MIIASIMTGTSVDGADISIRDFNSKENIGLYSFSFNNVEKEYISKFLWPSKKNIKELSEFNFKFSHIVGKYYKRIPLIIRNKINYVVYHGQTVFHDPNKIFNSYQSTLQLGNGAVLANIIKNNVISDLRSSDVSVGGQGAPLVVYGDKELFWDKKSKFLIFNIGGISNVSIIEKDGSLKGYDLGMGNSILDLLASKWFNAPYDKDGKVAIQGKINKNLYQNILKNDDFINCNPPKSTGKEVYNWDFVLKLNIEKYNKYDVMRTFTKYIADTVLSALKFENYDEQTKFVIAGGGAYNPLIVKYIKEEISNLKLSTEYNVKINEREAAAFSVLGYYYVNNIKIGETTGAKERTIPGCLYKYVRENNK